ncbi:DUF559 domain-containing protein [Vibrio sp. SCSIO 43140]|uniref:endonuclease domain-containing protein n=1 Tax=Vibrio sp. SCSIO 43140 TaxID=2819100 RepID=UPI0020756D18|nr:endonuclease domain-containing protein [Vibrio sp. SCSIO 43140]USD63426.1 DUF559 domain-containing protein [Vibrio sp. SCSIO 43140]
MKRHLYNDSQQTGFRKQLRSNPTLAEARLWYYLRRGQLGAKFRRQYGVGQYVLDFYSTEVRLAIEVDGDSHYSERGLASDVRRSEFLESVRIRVVRFTNQEVLEETTTVVEMIKGIIAKLKK